MTNHLKSIPGFATLGERNVWFVGSVATIALGLWFVATLLRFYSDPGPFDLAPTSMIPAFWFVAAVGLLMGGGVGAYLGIRRLNNTTDM